MLRKQREEPLEEIPDVPDDAPVPDDAVVSTDNIQHLTELIGQMKPIGSFTALDIEPATIDEIVVFTSKKGEDYE